MVSAPAGQTCPSQSTRRRRKRPGCVVRRLLSRRSNTSSHSTSWGSLVRAQYRPPKESPAQAGFLLRAGFEPRRLCTRCQHDVSSASAWRTVPYGSGPSDPLEILRLVRRHRSLAASSEEHDERDERRGDDHAEADQDPGGQPDRLLNAPEDDVPDPSQGRPEPENHS
jgi:hypothetical protein